MDAPQIPKMCRAAVVVNEGPDFRVEVQLVATPEPSEHYPYSMHECSGPY